MYIPIDHVVQIVTMVLGVLSIVLVFSSLCGRKNHADLFGRRVSVVLAAAR